MFFEMTSRYYIAVECSLYLSSKESNIIINLCCLFLNWFALKCKITICNLILGTVFAFTMQLHGRRCNWEEKVTNQPTSRFVNIGNVTF